MRTITSLVLFAFAVPVAAAAQPVAEVSVRIGDDLRSTAEKKHYGERDLDRLATDLERSVERSLERGGRLSESGGRLELELADARPSRPTFEELSRRPGLSYQSLYAGGAEIQGEYVAPDGTRTPLRYRWYEDDLRDNLGSGAWSDAERAIDRFARKVGRGELPNKR